MPPSQQDSASKHAQAGKTPSSPSNKGDLKLPADDYVKAVGDSLVADAQTKMQNAVDKVRSMLNSRRFAGTGLPFYARPL